MAEKLCRILTTEALHAQHDASGATAVKLPAWLSLDLKMRMEMAEKLYRVLKLEYFKSANWVREINGISSKTLPGHGNSSIYNLESRARLTD